MTAVGSLLEWPTMEVLRSIRGMHDILPDEIVRWHRLEGIYRELAERFGYQEVRSPLLEPLELFVRGIGEVTDIVEKEMYTFLDKGGDHLALRPEGTASAIRAYIQHSVGAREQQTKWYYLGPMFRRERPAKGRYRQFYQAGAELIGTAAPQADAELIEMAVQFVESLGITGVTVLLNSLGDRATRPQFSGALVAYFQGHAASLCPDCRRRLEVNPLRILDCKVENCIAIAAHAPSVFDYLSTESQEHFKELTRILDRHQTAYEVQPSMVRGLDYYTKTIFEIHGDTEALGAQAAIVGGGRYDELIEQLGGRPTPAIGFSFGLERLLLVLGDQAAARNIPLVYVAAVGEGGLDRAADLALQLRRSKQMLRIEVPYSQISLKAQLKRADRLGAQVVIIAGEDEAARQAVTWRRMSDSHQEEVAIGELPGRIGNLG